jgi:heme-degrading monooxygenase HmoA
MTELVTTATWTVTAGNEAAFIAAWAEFAEWASSMPGARTLRLGQDRADPGRFVSFASWESAEAAHEWKATPEFPERMARVRLHVATFQPSELDEVATAAAGSHTIVLPA